MSTELATTNGHADIMERVLLVGDLSRLQPGERVNYYNAVCSSLKLNPLTRPFDYINLSGKLTLYAKRDCTDQLRNAHKVSIIISARERLEDVYVVTARATMPDGRTDESVGAVNIAGLKGDNLANAFMKAETKAKRRVTLSIVGLGWMDETEIETVRDAVPVAVDTKTGEIKAQPAAEYSPSPRTQSPAQASPTAAADMACPDCGKPMRRSKYPSKVDGQLGYYCGKPPYGCGRSWALAELQPSEGEPEYRVEDEFDQIA